MCKHTCHTSHTDARTHAYEASHIYNTSLSLTRVPAARDCTQQKARLTRRKQKKTRASGENFALRIAGKAGGRRCYARVRWLTRKNARSVATKNCQYYLSAANAVLPPRVCFPPGNFLESRGDFPPRDLAFSAPSRNAPPSERKQRTRSTRDDDILLKIINFSVTRQFHVRVTLFGGNGHHVFIKAAIADYKIPDRHYRYWWHLELTFCNYGRTK